MNNDMIIREYRDEDLNAALDIYNYYAKNSFAVYSDLQLNTAQFSKFLTDCRLFLVVESGGKVAGIGTIHHYKPFPNFSHTGVLAYFLREEFTGIGIGSKLLNTLFERGRAKGIYNYVAHISSKNTESLAFHKKMGFEEAGRVKSICTKFGEPVDVVWVQKIFEPGNTAAG